MVAGYFRALDTFVAEIDGIPHGVIKGAVLPEGDAVVQHDLAEGGLLFEPLDTGEAAAPKSTAKTKPAAAGKGSS